MAKTSKGMILNSQNKLQSDLQFVLIDIDDKDSMSLIRSVDQNSIFIDAVSKRTNWIRSSLDQLGLKAGCYLISDLRDQTNVDIVSLINAFSPIRQYGYQVGIIADINQLPSLDDLIKNQVYLINSGKSNQKQDALLQNNEIDDCSGKLSKGMSVAWQRDYTNVDISIDRAGYVGMGQDTLLKGGKGFGYSTNGKDFNTVISPKGIIFRRADAERMWRLLRPKEINDIDMTVNDRVKKMVDSATAEIPQAVSNANEAVKKADSAIASSKVNSDAIVAQSEAISEAKAAMERATAEIQQTAANAASDAAKIRADVARVQNEVDTAKTANSASVEALKSDIDTAKQDLANMHDSLTKAQSAVEQNQKLINDSVAKISNDIVQDRKDLATAQQNNANTAKQLNDYSKQAEAQGKTIKSIQDKQDSFTATLADVQGNVSQVSDKVDGLSASLKDAQGNVATVKAQADQLNATLTDHAKSIATLTASAKELSSTLEDADGRLSKVEQTAQTNSSTLSDVQGNLSQVKQQADGLVSTLKNAQGNISTLQQKTDSVSAQLASAQGDIASLQTDVTGIKATLVSHEGDIHTLQADSKSLHDSMQDAQGDISTLKKTSTDVTSELKDHAGRISKTEQTASTLVNELADQQGHLSRVEQTAQGTQQTVANQQGQINSIQTDVAGIHETLTGQGNQIANINVTLSGLNSKYEGVSGDLNKLKSQAQWVTVTSAVDLNNVKTPCHEFLKGTVTNAPNETAWWYLTVESSDDGNRVTQTVIADQSNNRYTRRWADSWSAWVKDATQADVTTLSNRITTNSTQITQNKQAIALKADQSTVNNLSGEVSHNAAQLKVQADQISSKVSSEDFKTLDNKVGGAIAQIDKNTTAIGQTNKQISLKADQTEVNQVKGTASENSSRLDTMANEIKSKVTSTDVNNIVDGKGYATTSTVQSLVDQKAGMINESITNLTTELKNNNGGGVNLLLNSGTLQFSANVTSQTNNPNSADSLWHLSVGSLADWLKDNPTVTKLGISYDYELTGTTKASGIIRFGVNQAPAWEYMSGYNLDGKPLKGRAKTIIDVTNDMRNSHTDITRIRGDGLPIGATLKITHPKWEIGAVTPYSQAPSDNATVTQVQSLTASIDGLQSTVANKADKSQITQLSNVIQSKVSSSDFNDLKDKTLWKSTDSIDLNTAVSQQKIFVKGGSNLPPGGYWWYVRVEPGYDNRVVQYAVSDRNNIHCSRQYDGWQWTAWSQGATESEITQLRDDINLRVKSGDLLSQINLTAHNTLIQSNKIYLDSSSTVFSGKAFIPSAAITSLEADKITTGTLNGIEIRQLETDGRSIDIKNGNIAIMSHDPYESRISFTNDGKNMKMFNAVGDIEVLNQEFALFNFTPEDTHSLNPIPFFKVTNTGQIGSGGAQLNMDHAIFDGYEWWTPSAGVTFGRTWNGVDKSSDYADIYAKSFVPHSELSAKTRIKKLDRKEALDKIMQDDMYTYQFKEDVRDGVSKRYASFIIDNIHDVAQYTEPEEFLSANGKGRDDGTQLAYLIAAVQYQQEQIEELKKKLEEK